MPRYKLTIEYDGTGLAGWQRQNDAPSVQQYIEEAIERYCGVSCHVQCAGRTDAGVHATGQIAHVDLPKERDTYSIQQGINYHLKTDQISILSAESVDDEFNARFDAKRRYYLYRIIMRSAPLAIERNRAWLVHDELDIAAMKEASSHLLGTHDFTSFRDSQCQAKSPIKTLDTLDITSHGTRIDIRLDALSFLHHQVRIIVGTLHQVGIGKWSPQDIITALQAKERRAAGPTAAACGLYLMKVDYDT